MEVNGLPLHPLVVHAVVVFVPLGALAAIVFALVPRWRWLLRWPTLVLALGGVAVTRLAVVSGLRLKSDRQFGGPLVDRHVMWGHRLEYAVWVFAIVAVVAWWVLPYAVPLVGREDRPSPVASVATAVTILLPITAAVVLVFAVITGDAGAQTVWKLSPPTG
jgi:hypothetical protein